MNAGCGVCGNTIFPHVCYVVNGDWIMEWIADENGNVLRIEGDKCSASYRWVFRERIWTPDEVAAER